MDEKELLAVLTPELRDIVLNGGSVVEGKDPNKPVVRNAKGRIQKGSGVVKKHVDMAVISKEYAYKRKKSYRQALESIIDADGPPDKKGTFLWWLRQAEEAAEGAPIPASCPECNHKFQVPYGKKDGGLIYKIIELVHGRATETKEVTYKDETMEKILQYRAENVEVKTWDQDEAGRAVKVSVIDAD
jgi:hypothetical protein